MRPKQPSISRRIGGRARWSGGRARWSAAAVAGALAVVTCAGVGPGAKADSTGGASAGPPETFTDPADPTGLTTAVTGLLGQFSPPVQTCSFPPCAIPSNAIPAYAATNTVDVKVGKGPTAAAVNKKTNKIYVANIRDNTVSVIDGKTDKVIATVKTGEMPNFVAVNDVTDRIYVANQDLDDPIANHGSTLTVIDGKRDKVIDNVTIEVQPGEVVVNKKTNKVYVVNNGTNSLSVLDGKTNKVDATLHFRPDGRAPLESGVMSPYEVKVNEITNTIYVTGPQSNTVAVIDGKTNKWKIVGTGSTPTGASIDPITNTIYITDMTTNDLTVLDGKTNKTTTIPLKDVQDPLTVAVNPKTNKIYVGNLTSRSISVVDGDTGKSFTISDLPGKPHDTQINTVTNKIYFPMYILFRGNGVGDDLETTGVIEELDGTTNQLTTVMAGTTPYAITINDVTNKIYCMNQDSNTVTVFSPPN
jgi:YVTN family beta-propeller protein